MYWRMVYSKFIKIIHDKIIISHILIIGKNLEFYKVQIIWKFMQNKKRIFNEDIYMNF